MSGFVGVGHMQTSIKTKFSLAIDRYDFFGADAHILAVYGAVADNNISKTFKSCFLLHYQKYNILYVLPFFQKLQKSGFITVVPNVL